MPDGSPGRMAGRIKGGIFRDRPPMDVIAAYQLVGGVMAYQGDDG
eukprot:CAMPEP_0168795340 /NCGR_PEP_ID=MMETSP0725-20121227/16139_1 /TAXON_ID=265536 /ORGANISM="Amphiprora sp., Strain CCMP467" /LENGTH=44 /DNA_ID= /DNA_START= /DNA_END= /DNA_ORIENTATION=